MATGPTFECEQCGDRYLSIGKLNEHRQSHLAGTFICQYCQREFHHARNLKGHLRVCSKRPGSAVIQEFKCELCGSKYVHKRDLTVTCSRSIQRLRCVIICLSAEIVKISMEIACIYMEIG